MLDIKMDRFYDMQSYLNHKSKYAEEYKTRWQFDREICTRQSIIGTDPFYGIPMKYKIQSDNLRETGIDDYNLNNRLRACMLLYNYALTTRKKDDIRTYMTEQVTPCFQFVQKHTKYKELIGSEYLHHDLPSGTINKGVRHEDLNRLSFKDNYFDFILSFEVLEHVPTYKTALIEIFRTLKKNGLAIITAPFTPDKQAHTIRARMGNNGNITHILPPEYHGDPVNKKGVLCFHYFGWDVLKELKEVGFESAAIYSIYSKKHCILGLEQLVIVAQK